MPENDMADTTLPTDPKTPHSFAEFYPLYLSEHRNLTCRRLHFVGSTLALLCLWCLAWTREPAFIVAALVCGYGFAWIGHFVFEKNRPATFRYPVYSLLGDWVMYWQLLTRKIPFEERDAGTRQGADRA
jgi:hypothetical protein